MEKEKRAKKIFLRSSEATTAPSVIFHLVNRESECGTQRICLVNRIISSFSNWFRRQESLFQETAVSIHRLLQYDVTDCFSMDLMIILLRIHKKCPRFISSLQKSIFIQGLLNTSLKKSLVYSINSLFLKEIIVHKNYSIFSKNSFYK